MNDFWRWHPTLCSWKAASNDWKSIQELMPVLKYASKNAITSLRLMPHAALNPHAGWLWVLTFITSNTADLHPRVREFAEKITNAYYLACRIKVQHTWYLPSYRLTAASTAFHQWDQTPINPKHVTTWRKVKELRKKAVSYSLVSLGSFFFFVCEAVSIPFLLLFYTNLL